MRATPSRILIIRLSAIGDVVMASGLIPALRNLWPQARISWLVEPAAAPLLQHNAHLDEVIVWPRGEWQKLWRERRWRDLWRQAKAFRKSLKERQFDLVLDAQGLLKSGIWAWLSGAPRRLGLISREGSRFLMTEQVIPGPQSDKPMSAEYRFLAKFLGAEPETFKLNLAVGTGPLAVAKDLLANSGVDKRPVALLCPFTTRPQKHWFEERWAELGKRLANQGYIPIMLGGPGDTEAAQHIASASPAIINFTGKLRLDESMAVISQGSLLIGVDTGLTHMGTALNIPTVALFGSTCPYLNPKTARTVILYEKLSCSPCRRNPTCGGRFDCMRMHTVNKVLQAATAAMEAA